jgi:predicted branched-subunit amino acid permease
MRAPGGKIKPRERPNPAGAGEERKPGTVESGSRVATPALQVSPQLIAGARAVLPVLPGVATFGVITGVAMIGAGLSAWGALAMSVIVFAGTAQLAALQLAAAGASLPVIFFAALVINLRFALYSLSVSRYVGHAPRRLRIALSYLLSDNGYAHAIARFGVHPDEPRKPEYLLGSEIMIWTAWQAATVAGIAVGKGLPREWSLEFIVTLTFLALAAGAIRDRPALAAALASGAVAIASYALPYRLGLLLATAAGVAAGLVADRWTRSHSPA